MRSLFATLLLSLLQYAHAQSSDVQSVARVTAVDSMSLTVSDMERAVNFYTHVLTFAKVADREVAGEDYEHLFGVSGARLRSVRLRLGDEYIELIQFLAPHGRPFPVDSHSNDRWFQHVAIVVSDMKATYSRLRSFNVQRASRIPQRLPDRNPNAAGIEAFYFRDPDRHYLEVLAFPPGKGLPKWHQSDGHLFLGIDHTAIVVSDTAASLHFYRDVLGLRVVGESDNYGTEQEHLNNVSGAHLRITSLRAARGPGVEFLEYLAPRTGRPLPADTKPTDIWYWQINLRGVSASIGNVLRNEHIEMLSPEVVRLRDTSLGWSEGILAHDPDGHTSLIAAAEPPKGLRSSD